MKKLLSATLAVALVFGAAGATAQTMAISAGAPGIQVAETIPGTPFDVVVWGDTGTSDSAAAEFVATELLQVTPGVFKLATVKINNTTLDLGDNALGEYILAFAACFLPDPQLELVRVTYGDFSGVVGADVVMTLRGLQPGDSRPSSFNGSVGFVDCQDVKYSATVGGVDGGVTGSGVVFPDGGLVLNPTPIAVDNDATSFGQVKARF
jgi:hypothetical protein